MNTPASSDSTVPHDKAFLFLTVLVSLAFLLILWPFWGAVLWAVVLAILFARLNRWLVARMRQKRTLAALVTLVLIVVMVILPVTLIVASLVNEASGVYERLQSGQLNLASYVQRLFNSLPEWATDLLNNFGLTNLNALQERLSSGVAQGSKFLVTQAINIGQNTFNFFISLFVTLYLLFFLLRDGDDLTRRIKAALPLRKKQQRALFEKFTVVIRATVKGNIVVALLQGALGGLIFWFLGIHGPLLWGVVMAILSLLPAVGAGLVWLPVAIYFLATGSMGKGITLLAYGVLVISLVDNVVRPILVGKDTKIPDYVVLISTLGGIAVFGINGFVVGPVIAAMFIATWNIHTEANNQSVTDGEQLPRPNRTSG